MARFLNLLLFIITSHVLKFREIIHPVGLLCIEQSKIKIAHDHGSIDFLFDLSSFYNVTALIEENLNKFRFKCASINRPWCVYHEKNLDKQFHKLTMKQFNLDRYGLSSISKKVKRVEPISMSLILIGMFAIGGSAGWAASYFQTNSHNNNIKEIQQEKLQIR